jgi:hypothetical protein
MMMFVVNNMGLYQQTSQIHGFNTRRNFDLCQPKANLAVYQKGPYCFGIKLFNHLPQTFKELAKVNNIKQFKLALNGFLHSKYFYTLDEYINKK